MLLWQNIELCSRENELKVLDRNLMRKKNNWEHFSGSDWSSLLQHQPCFADKCDWSKLDGGDWMRLLVRQPQFADRCDWSKLDGGDWACLLRWHPDICGECVFSKLSASDWIYVLSYRPELASKFETVDREWCDDEQFDYLDSELMATEVSKGKK